MTHVSVVGAGYVGLVTGVCLAEKGCRVVCVDVDTEKVAAINRAICPIYEQGLAELLKRNVGSRFFASTDIDHAVLMSDVTLVAVGTPFDGTKIDLTYVKEATRQIGTALRDKSSYHVVAVKSTVVPGTTDEIVRPILEESSGKKAGVDFGLGMNPEFLTEGVAVHDFMCPDRIVLGGIDQRTIDTLDMLYNGFEGVIRIRTNNKTAEMIKYASNALLGTMISFSNELGNLCSALGGIDIVDVLQAIHINNYLSVPRADGSRVQAPIARFLEAGCGFGGSCLPKDIQALVSHGRLVGQPMRLLDAVIQTNREQHLRILALLKKHFPSLHEIRIAILGLSFKPDTDDMRESPAIPIIRSLLQEGSLVQAYDPAASHQARKIFGDQVTVCDGLLQAIEGVDAIVLVTRWEEFRRVPEILRNMDRKPVFVDGRRLIDKHSAHIYEGIGL